MAQNISLLGASYTDVPSVLLPKTGGGTAQFDDTTDANASASDIAMGKTAYVGGVKLTGYKSDATTINVNPNTASVVDETLIIVGGGTVSLQEKTNIDPTTSSQTITADSGYDGLSSVQINAMPSGSATTPATTITANPSISVSNSGLITATASASQSVTPTITSGYVSSGTSGTITVSGSNTSQLTTMAGQSVTPTTSSQTVATNGKYMTGDVTVGAIPSNYIVPSGSLSITTNDTYDVTQYASAVVNVSGSSKNVQIANGVNRVATTEYTAVSGQTLTVAETGKYDVYWGGYRSSTGGTSGSQLYIDGTAYGSANTTFSNHGQSVHLSNVSLTKNQVIAVRARARSTSYYMYVSNLTIIQN